MKADPKKPLCPQCNGSGEIAVVDASRKRVLVVCAGRACQAAAEDREEARAARRDSARTVNDIMVVILAPENIQRLLAKLLCHLPIEMSKGGKRG